MIFILPIPVFGVVFLGILAFAIFLVFVMIAVWIYKLIASFIVGG